MRYAICNETFEGWDHLRICKCVSALGYTGLEMAPFTLAPRVQDITASRRIELRKQAEDQGVQLLGLHWLLAKTEGLHLTSPDAAVRRRTAEYLIELARCCRDLGGTLMVFGSPAQRNILPGCTREQAVDHAVDTFSQSLRGLVEAGIKLCLEPLGAQETKFMNTCAEAVEILRRLDSSSFQLHLDVKAMSSENRSIPELIRTHGSHAGHFHANDPNKRGPGFGKTDFTPIFQALRESAYKGWVSVEVFDYSPDPETIARESIRYMKECDTSARS